MIRREPDLLHPRLTVVPTDSTSRPALHDAPGRTVIGRAELDAAAAAVADRRRAELRVQIAELGLELEDAEVRRAEAEANLDRRRADRDGLVDDAAWSEALPEARQDRQAAVATAEADLLELLRESRDAARALDRVLEQRASADAAIAEARRQLASLDRSADPDGERERAAAALAAQAESVEARLTEAEADARARSERSKRAVTDCERAIDDHVRAQRDDEARLRSLLTSLPGDARPPHDEDPVDHVAAIATGLRALAETVDGELRALEAATARCRLACEELRRDITELEQSLDHAAPGDAALALADLVAGVVDGVVVLDDVVTTERAGADDSLLRALEETQADAPLVLLSSDPAVLAWAIDLPADRGAIAGPRAIDLLTAAPIAAMSCPTTAPLSMGDHA